MRRPLQKILVGCAAVGSLAAITVAPASVQDLFGARARAADLDTSARLDESSSQRGAGQSAIMGGRGGHEASQAEGGGELPILFPAPRPPAASPPLPVGAPEPRRAVYPGPSDALRASARYHIARVFERPSTNASARALVRRGGLLRVTGRAGRGRGCGVGRWYAVAPEGYVCTTKGFGVFDWDKPHGYVTDAPDRERGLPYIYGKLVDQGALMLDRVPTREEWSEVLTTRAEQESGASSQEATFSPIVREQLKGAYFFALASREETDSGAWLHTVRGRVLPMSAVVPLPVTRMRGELLREGRPVAFVITDRAPVLSAIHETPEGVAQRYGRFELQGELTRDGVEYVRVPGGRLLRRQDVRRMRRVDRPDGVPRDERWVHVDVREQVLVAYEGDEPVFATLVASGIEGHETPPGLYRVREKHTTATMSGPDPDMGVYDVEEVPWTQYFSGDFALHGAYWHDAFGKVRSHGCVNLPPEDARWLFNWTSPDMPDEWHAVRQAEGTWVFVTG